ncbi:MEKHLA domain-containing protein [Rhodobacteraceae bacterium HSP-20]|uniref:MEKHLA domain-containing protein n=1 Tax=Paragemmobacter amnigenus TaxID=2852097 RepID=A0ABS6J7T3_9RHOB|nr:MEKHLA domain-containing protein [Rhodobacter amnigenus]MBU9699816.1 MEKHLA domain-containing protein [Rhodobacter amnigenus]MBV4391043.1 MEKHLA domain-containing protein [Rhodobacter amnigenus]
MSRRLPVAPTPPDPLRADGGAGWQQPAAIAYARLLVESLHRLTGHAMADPALPDAALAAALWDMARPLVSHGTEPDPVFRHANRAALSLWEMDWYAFTRLPSRHSAEADTGIQTDRSALLARALQQGWVDGYEGIRISATGRRFRISQTVLWTVTDATGTRHGQAALIGRVTPL